MNVILQLLGADEFVLVSDEERKRSTFIFSTLGFSILVLFGLGMMASQEHRLQLQGLFQILEAVFFMLPVALLSYKKAGQARLAENLLVLFGFVIFITLTIFGGFYGDAIYWTFVFPYLIFFIRGQRVGWFLGTLYAILAPLGMVYSARHWGLWPYTDNVALFYGLAFFFNVISAAYFNLLRYNFLSRLHQLVEFNTKEARTHLDTLQFNAIHDVPTGLLNQQGVIEAIRHAQAAPDPANPVLILACMRFKRVVGLANIIGTDNVNLSLIQLANKLQAMLPMGVSIGRSGMDELIFLFQVPNRKTPVVEHLLGIEHLAGLNDVSGFSLHNEYSFGLAYLEADAVENAPTELLRKAEQALLYALHHHQHFQFYDKALDAHFMRHNLLYEKIRAAVLTEKLQLHYQPQMDLKRNTVVGVEALARWFDPQEGAISPALFVPIIETTGLLKRFSIWTIRQALHDCAQWQPRLPGVTVSLNLSANALLDLEVIDALEAALKQHQLAPSLIMVELTESVMLNEPETALKMMNRIVALGVRLSIDDYGAGFSSLTYVKQLPAHELKIDMSFIKNLVNSAQDQAIVESTIELGQNFGLKVLAEGVEDAATLELLQKLGCDLGQGWHYAKAMPLDAFQDWTLNRIKTLE